MEYLLLLLLIPHLVQIQLPELSVHGFQITSPFKSSIYGDAITRSIQVQQKHQQQQQQQLYRYMASSSELMEPATTPSPATTDDVHSADEVTDASKSPSRNNNSESYIIQKLREEIIELGRRTERGFKASRSDRVRAEKLILDLAQYNPVREPVRTYYGDKLAPNTNVNVSDSSSIPSIQGKWTLIYTDAPDITGLGVPSPLVKLGRIGQDCSHPPYIANVIEWCAPSWANRIPFLVGKNKNSNEASARILQKVITFGSAVPASPMVVDLNVAGLQLSSGTNQASIPNETNGIRTRKNSDLRTAIEEDGLIVGILKQQQKDQPNIDLLKLDESRQPPFGSFEILYLDESLRITKTSQNHYAINIRIQSPEDEWF
jgi:hypothetical protein